MSGTDFIEVPPPLYKYEGGGHIHDDNKKVLEAHERDRRVVLSGKQVKQLTKLLDELNQQIETLAADEDLKRYDERLQAYNSAKIDYESDDISDSERQTIKQQAKALRDDLQQLKGELAPVRQRIRQRERVRQRLQAHHTAVAEEKKESELLKLMAKEANIIGEQMSRTLSRVGFSYTYTVKDRTYTDYVQFEKCVTTPDQHQFKIAASRRGLAGGTIELLPQGVRVTDILQDWVMRELSTTLEREVWSPHVNEDVNNTNGAWVVVERLGLYEGIPKTVTYRQIMARYETADAKRIPIPAGLKRGRRINWQYLDSHSSTHMMFTGITGSGKTNAIQASIAAIVEKQSPRDTLFVLIDLKNQGDFNDLAAAPHVLKTNETGIISNIDEVVSVLQNVRDEMHWRQRRIGSVAKNIGQFNRSVQAKDRLPRIVVLFDEYANTRRGRFQEQAAMIDDICTEITQIGRASGIHLWIGIQQPRQSNMPQALRDNFTTMFVGHQANVGAGQSVTGNRASLKLADLPGRMLCFSGWKQFEVQMPLITDHDIQSAVKIATESHQDKLYELHVLDPSEQPVALTKRDIILETAMEQLQGGLKVRPLHELLKGQMSRSEIKTIVDGLVDEGIIPIDDVMYAVVKKPGNFYQLEIP